MPSLSSSTRKRGLAVNAEAGASRSPADCAPQCLHVSVSHACLTGSHTAHATSPAKRDQEHALVPPRELARLPLRRLSARESEGCPPNGEPRREHSHHVVCTPHTSYPPFNCIVDFIAVVHIALLAFTGCLLLYPESLCCTYWQSAYTCLAFLIVGWQG